MKPHDEFASAEKGGDKSTDKKEKSNRTTPGGSWDDYYL